MSENIQQFIDRVSTVAGIPCATIPQASWEDVGPTALILASRRESAAPGDSDTLVSVDWQDGPDGPVPADGSYRMIWQAQHDAPSDLFFIWDPRLAFPRLPKGYEETARSPWETDPSMTKVTIGPSAGTAVPDGARLWQSSFDGELVVSPTRP